MLPFVYDLSHQSFVNPAGLPLKQGEVNYLFFAFSLSHGFEDIPLATYYKGLAPGADIPVMLILFSLSCSCDVCLEFSPLLTVSR